MAARTLLTVEHLPAHNSSAERIAAAHADVEEAVAKLRAKLRDYASKMVVMGWTEDPEGIQFDLNDLTVIGRLRITRED